MIKPAETEAVKPEVAGGEADLDYIIEEYSKGIYTLALRLTGNRHDADDLYQQTFLKIAEKGSLKKSQNIQAYLYTTTINIYRKNWRKRKKEVLAYDDSIFDTEDISDDPEAAMQNAERRKAVALYISQLPDDCRIPVLLYYQFSFDVNSIAKHLKIPAGTVKSRLARARKIIKKRLEEGQWTI